MDGQRFVADARTLPLYALYDLGGYPGMVRTAERPDRVEGEVWEVNETALQRLDQLEGLEQGEYCRVAIPLAPPHEDWGVQGYEYLLDVTGATRLGSVWSEA